MKRGNKELLKEFLLVLPLQALREETRNPQHGCAGMFFKVFLPVSQLRLFFVLDTWYVTPGVLN
jgi:hypothetical protein